MLLAKLHVKRDNAHPILEDKWFSDNDPIDWDRLKEFKGIFRLFQEMIALRRNLKGNTKGLTGQNIRILHLDYNEKIIAFQRWYEDETKDSVVVILNFRNNSHDTYSLPFQISGNWKIQLNSDEKIYDSDFTDHATKDLTTDENAIANISIGPYTALIYSLEHKKD